MKVMLDTPTIKAFFDGESDDAPVDEFLYINEKAIIQSFMTDISDRVVKAVQKAKAKNIKIIGDVSVSDSYKAFILLAMKGVMEDDREILSEALKHLREIYQSCERVLSI